VFLILPYAVKRRLRSVPWVTLALIAVNIVVFLLTRRDVATWATRLGFFADARGLFTWLTSMFLHESAVSLVLDVYFLWLFGSFLEDALGRVRFSGLYLAGGLASALLQAAMSAGLAPAAAPLPVVGASGAIAALVGVFAVGFRTTKMRFAYFWFVLLRWRAGVTSRSSAWGIALWGLTEVGVAIWNRFAGFPVHHAAWAHLGGLAFGAAAALASPIAK
jgi:membrane associated rhomboid family serine protease